MPQGDLNIANQSGAAFRADLNNQLLALGTLQSGPSEPSTTYAYQWWADTSADQLKIRNAANNGWITVGTLSAQNLGLAAAANVLPLTGGTLTGELALEGQLTGTNSGLSFPLQGGNRFDLRSDTFSGVGDNLRFRQGGGGAESVRLIVSQTDNTDRCVALRGVNAGGSVEAANSLLFRTGATLNAANERMRITSAGNVGIGTSSPETKLAVAGNIVAGQSGLPTVAQSAFTGIATYHQSSAENEDIESVYIRKNSGDGSTTSISFGIAGGNSYFVGQRIKAYREGANGNGGLIFETKADGSINTTVERLRITSAGNVGIGTTSPAEQLHITDNFRIGSAVFQTPSGSAPIYACRAWVNFDGTITTGNIRASGNVSSVVRTAAGEFTVNFITAMPDGNYALNGTATHSGNFSQNTTTVGLRDSYTPETTSVRINVNNNNPSSGSFANRPHVFVTIFR